MVFQIETNACKRNLNILITAVLSYIQFTTKNSRDSNVNALHLQEIGIKDGSTDFCTLFTGKTITGNKTQKTKKEQKKQTEREKI